MEEQWIKYGGVFGLIIIALAAFILLLRKEAKEERKEHQKALNETIGKVDQERKEWRETLERISHKQEQVIERVMQKHEKVVENLTEKHEEAIDDIANRHEEAIKEVAETIDKRQGETNQVIREQIGLLNGLKVLLEQGIKNNKSPLK